MGGEYGCVLTGWGEEGGREEREEARGVMKEGELVRKSKERARELIM